MKLRLFGCRLNHARSASCHGENTAFSQSVDQLLVSTLFPLGKVPGTQGAVAPGHDGKTKAGECCGTEGNPHV